MAQNFAALQCRSRLLKAWMKIIGLLMLSILIGIWCISNAKQNVSRQYILESKLHESVKNRMGKIRMTALAWRNMGGNGSNHNFTDLPPILDVFGDLFGNDNDDDEKESSRDFDDDRDLGVVDNILNSISKDDSSSPKLLSGSGSRYSRNLTVYSPEKHQWTPTAFPYSVRRRWYRRNDVEGAWANYNWTRHGPHSKEIWIALQNAANCVKRGLRTQEEYDDYIRELTRFTNSLMDDARRPSKKHRKSKVRLEWCQWAETMVPCAPGYGGAWYPAGGRSADYGIWPHESIPQLKCPLPANGTNALRRRGNSVYAGNREQVYWPWLGDSDDTD